MKQTQLSKNVDKLAEALKKREDALLQKSTFCKEHNFTKEEEWLRLKYSIVQEIRSEVELLKRSAEYEYRPYFSF